MGDDQIQQAYTFDDLLLLPAASAVLPTEVNLETRLTRNLRMNIPLVSAAMDTVTEAEPAICMARQGGIGIIHKNMSIERQALEVEKVKKSESGMILDPVTIHPDAKISQVLELMQTYRISGIPVVENNRLVGIVTNRDLRFETNLDLPVRDVMTKDHLVTAPVGITLEESKALLHKYRIEKLLVVGDDFQLKGLITIKDIEKIKKYPAACKDEFGRLRVGAAVGVGDDRAARIDALLKPGWRRAWTSSRLIRPMAIPRMSWTQPGPANRSFPALNSSSATSAPMKPPWTSSRPGPTPSKWGWGRVPSAPPGSLPGSASPSSPPS